MKLPGYSCTVADIRLLSTFTGIGINTPAAQTQNQQSVTSIGQNTNTNQTLGTDISSTIIGTQINLRGTTINTLFGTVTQIRSTLTFIGLDSGARITIPLTITKTT